MSFAEIMRITPDMETSPKPILVDFLERYRLTEADVIDDKIKLMGVSPEKDDAKPLRPRRVATFEEIREAGKWIEEIDQKAVSPILNLNIKLLTLLVNNSPTKPL